MLDVVFMDVNMFGIGGLEVIKKIVCMFENMCVICVLMYKESFILM